MEKISRSEAIIQEKKFYFTGRKCLRGNIARRYLNGACTCDKCARSRTEARKKALKSNDCKLTMSEQLIMQKINRVFR